MTANLKTLIVSVIPLLILITCLTTASANSIQDNTIVINRDGSVTGTNSIQQVGNTYTLTANISGKLLIAKSNTILDGAGYTLDGGGNGGIDVTIEWGSPAVDNVTVKNVFITNGYLTMSGWNNTVYNISINSSNYPCIQLYGSSYTSISYCTLNSTNSLNGAVLVTLGGENNTLTQNNIFGGIDTGSTIESVDGNYWGDYSTKYPNATEIDRSGVGNTPYVYYAHINNDTIPCQDTHPLINPVVIALTASISQTNVPELTWLMIVPLLLSVFAAVVVLRHRKNR